ncbi:hypothetical protein F2P56_023144, partial [Juglans regia]
MADHLLVHFLQAFLTMESLFHIFSLPLKGGCCFYGRGSPRIQLPSPALRVYPLAPGFVLLDVEGPVFLLVHSSLIVLSFSIFPVSQSLLSDSVNVSLSSLLRFLHMFGILVFSLSLACGCFGLVLSMGRLRTNGLKWWWQSSYLVCRDNLVFFFSLHTSVLSFQVHPACILYFATSMCFFLSLSL